MSPKPTLVTVPHATSDVTPEMALTALERTITEQGGMWAKGARVNACRIAGQRLSNSLGELQAARAMVAKLENAMAPLVKEALAAVSGTTPPPKDKVATVGTSDTTSNPAGK